MNDKFFDLKKEKQDRMINAALKIFALQGYRHASTDDMVREAAISKGLLFHYFGSKLGVYTFVYDYSARYMMMEMKRFVKKTETNLFEVLKQQEQARLQVMKGYPYMQQFLNRCMQEDDPEALAAVEDRKRSLIEFYEEVLGQVDVTGLPQGVDGEKIWIMLELTIQGLLAKHSMEEDFQVSELQEEIFGYVDMVKGLVEKEE